MQPQAVHDERVLLREDRDGVAVLTLNRPHALNALNGDLLSALDAALAKVETEPDVHGVILTGAGDKAFCAGADIATMADLTPPQADAWGRRGQTLAARIERLGKPVVAAVNGYALGGGLELALACDWILAAPGTKVGQPEVTIGTVPGFGGTQRLARLVGRHAAKWLCMTGDTITTEEAHRLGLVVRLAPRERLVDEAVQMLSKVRTNAPVAVRLAKDVINQGTDLPLGAALELELRAFALTFATRDQKEGMKAFKEKRKPAYTGQ